MSASGNTSADLTLWLTQAPKYHFLYLGLSERKTAQLENTFVLRRWLLFLSLCIFEYSYCWVLYLLCPACSHLRLVGWSSAVPKRGKPPWSCSCFCAGNCLLAVLPGCFLFAGCSAELLFSGSSSQKACWSLQKHTCPAVGRRLPEGNLNLSVSEEFCSLRLWAVE